MNDSKIVKHTMNGDQTYGWYCYQCHFTTHDVEAAAEHDGSYGEFVAPVGESSRIGTLTRPETRSLSGPDRPTKG